MRNLLKCVPILSLVLVILQGVSFAAFDQLIPQRQRGKFFTPSIRLRQTYNDNLAAKRGSGGGRGLGHRRIKSMISYIEPKISLRIPWDQTYLGVDYKYSLAYFYDRPYDNEDVAHDINARFKHNFSPRLSFDLQNDYVHQEAGTIKRHRVVLGGKGDFERNILNLMLKYDFSRSVYMKVKYGYEFLDFDTRSSSETFDYYENMIGFETGYIVNKELIILGGYTVRDREYTLRENADYDSHLLFGGINYRLGKFFTLDAIAGVDFKKHEAPTRTNTGIHYDLVPPAPAPGISLASVTGPIYQGVRKVHNNPYVSVRLSTNYFRDMMLTFGYLYSVSTTEQSIYSSANSQSASFQLSYKVFPKVTVDFNMIYTYEWYNGRLYRAVSAGPGLISKVAVYSTPNTSSFRLGSVVSYQVTPWLFYEIGYRRTDIDSDFGTWERNEYFSGINAIF